jgi:hypothetical protein
VPGGDVTPEPQPLTAQAPHASGPGRDGEPASGQRKKRKRKSAAAEDTLLPVGKERGEGGAPGSGNVGARKKRKGKRDSPSEVEEVLDGEMPDGATPGGEQPVAPGGGARQLDPTAEMKSAFLAAGSESAPKAKKRKADNVSTPDDDEPVRERTDTKSKPVPSAERGKPGKTPENGKLTSEGGTLPDGQAVQLGIKTSKKRKVESTAKASQAGKTPRGGSVGSEVRSDGEAGAGRGLPDVPSAVQQEGTAGDAAVSTPAPDQTQGERGL